MGASLCPVLSDEIRFAHDFDKFFTPAERKQIERLEVREHLRSSNPHVGCDTNIFAAFFFDGTKNNYVKAEPSLNHSNVARLYDCYPGLAVPGVLPDSTKWLHNAGEYTHFFKAYIPGVSSPFDAVGDDGEGMAGGAFGSGGERRIIWALLQAINNIHRFFNKTLLISWDEAKELSDSINMSADQREAMTQDPPQQGSREYTRAKVARFDAKFAFTKLLKRLHRAVSQHWPAAPSGMPAKIDPGILRRIYFSVFGFSRGSTQARVFTNWLMALCELDAELCGRRGKLTLGGFEVQFDFLGLFDTVASVGLGNTLGNSLLGRALDGHSDWADAERNLRVSDRVPCVHLIAAHEIRRSFPVESVSVNGVVPARAEEVVFPGVHSDVGCGYCPTEQGRGTDPYGSDMLPRFPLLFMYKRARLAGVPLKLEFASKVAQRRFSLSADALVAFNAYLKQCQVARGTLTSIMREQTKLHILWRKSRRISARLPLHMTPSFSRASTFDKNDLHSANIEFEDEVKLFETWLTKRGKNFVPRVQPAGFDDEHESEWEEIATWWRNAAEPPPAVLEFFDNYVHDSRAWFKLKGDYPDNEEAMRQNLVKWEKQRSRIANYNERQKKIYAQNPLGGRGWNEKLGAGGAQAYGQMSDGLTQQQRTAAMEYARTGQLPRMVTDGREPYYLGYGIYPRAGYLRYRKIYAGGDSLLLAQQPDAGQMNLEVVSS